MILLLCINLIKVLFRYGIVSLGPDDLEFFVLAPSLYRFLFRLIYIIQVRRRNMPFSGSFS